MRIASISALLTGTYLVTLAFALAGLFGDARYSGDLGGITGFGAWAVAPMIVTCLVARWGSDEAIRRMMLGFQCVFAATICACFLPQASASGVPQGEALFLSSWSCHGLAPLA